MLLSTFIKSLLALLVFVSPALAALTDGYRHDATAAQDNSNWMSTVQGTIRISQLSLPGTHDSGAYKAGGDIALTQSMSITEQLKAGIRVLDIRLGTDAGACAGPALWLFHGIICQKQKFSDVLSTVQTFLRQHSRETLLMRVRDENNGSITNFPAAVDAAISAFQALFYKGTETNPVLNNIRGKVVLLYNYAGQCNYGIAYNTANFNIQDNYNLKTIWNLATKWGFVENQLTAANQVSTKDITYVNYLSATGGGFPYFFASGKSTAGSSDPALLTGYITCFRGCKLPLCLGEYPRVNCVFGCCSVAFVGVNDLAMNYIRSSVKYRTGIVMADFPGPGLINAIIALNP